MPCKWEAEEMSVCNVNYAKVQKTSTQLVLSHQGIRKDLARKDLQQLGSASTCLQQHELYLY